MAKVYDLLGQQLKQRIDADNARRLEAYSRAWNYYDGLMRPQLKVAPKQHDDNTYLGYPTAIVDTAVSFLFGDQVVFKTEEESPAEEVIEHAWGADEQRLVTLQRMGVNGAVCGHVFVKLVPDMQGRARVQVLDPANVDVEWEPDDFQKVRRYVIEWTGYDEDLDKSISYRQTHATLDPSNPDAEWVITDEVSVGTSDYRVVDENLWPYPFSAVVECQNLPTANEFYGNPDLLPVALDLCDAINLATSNIQKILRYHAHPKVFVYGYSGKEIDMSVDSVVNFPSTDTNVGILGMPTDLAAAFQQLESLKAELLRVTRTPSAAMGDPNAAALAASGLALRLGFMPLVDKTMTKRQTYGHLLNEVNQRVQAIAGMEPTDVDLVWPSILPDDPLADAQTAILQQQLGVSSATLLAQLGFDPEVEAEQKQDEQDLAAEALSRQMAAGGFGQAPNGDSQAMRNNPAMQQRMARDQGAK